MQKQLQAEKHKWKYLWCDASRNYIRMFSEQIQGVKLFVGKLADQAENQQAEHFLLTAAVLVHVDSKWRRNEVCIIYKCKMFPTLKNCAITMTEHVFTPPFCQLNACVQVKSYSFDIKGDMRTCYSNPPQASHPPLSSFLRFSCLIKELPLVSPLSLHLFRSHQLILFTSSNYSCRSTVPHL